MSDCNTCTHLIHQKYGVKCEKNLLVEGVVKTPCKGYEKAWNYCNHRSALLRRSSDAKHA